MDCLMLSLFIYWFAPQLFLVLDMGASVEEKSCYLDRYLPVKPPPTEDLEGESLLIIGDRLVACLSIAFLKDRRFVPTTEDGFD